MSKTDIVMIELDRARELRFGHKALKMIKATFDKNLIDIIKDGLNDIEPKTLETIYHAGLIGDDKDLKIEDIEDIIDRVSFVTLITKMTDAINKTYGVDEATENDRFKNPEDKKK
jgi:hypothetical protein